MKTLLLTLTLLATMAHGTSLERGYSLSINQGMFTNQDMRERMKALIYGADSAQPLGKIINFDSGAPMVEGTGPEQVDYYAQHIFQNQRNEDHIMRISQRNGDELILHVKNSDKYPRPTTFHLRFESKDRAQQVVEMLESGGVTLLYDYWNPEVELRIAEDSLLNYHQITVPEKILYIFDSGDALNPLKLLKDVIDSDGGESASSETHHPVILCCYI